MTELLKLGVAAKRLEAEGYGDQHPVADNSTEEGRHKESEDRRESADEVKERAAGRVAGRPAVVLRRMVDPKTYTPSSATYNECMAF